METISQPGRGASHVTDHDCYYEGESKFLG